MREATPWEKLDGIKHTLDLVLESAVTWERERIIKLLERDLDVLPEFAWAIELIRGEQK